jgi:hypothetical protein
MDEPLKKAPSWVMLNAYPMKEERSDGAMGAIGFFLIPERKRRRSVGAP